MEPMFSNQKFSVLVVEDSPTMNAVCCNSLLKNGFGCRGTESPEEAFALLESAHGAGAPYDGLLMDWVMPGMGGKGLMEKINGDPRFEDLAVMIFSERPDKDTWHAVFTRENCDLQYKEDIAFLPQRIGKFLSIYQPGTGKTKERQNLAPDFSWARMTKNLNRIMVVDDSSTVRAKYRQVLIEAGYEVLTAGSKDEAFALAKKEVPCLAVVDYFMPEGNGDELIRELDQDPDTQIITAVMFSQRKDVVEEALRSGAVDLIYKDDPIHMFVMRIHSLMKIIRSQREAQQLQLIQAATLALDVGVMLVDNGGYHAVNSTMERFGRVLAGGLAVFDTGNEVDPEFKVENLEGSPMFFFIKRVEVGKDQYAVFVQDITRVKQTENDLILSNHNLDRAKKELEKKADELVRREEEKLLAQKMADEHEKLALVGQVAGKMAHDFNNILSIIMGNLELVLADPYDPDVVETLEMLLEQSHRGKNLTRNLVAFAKDNEPKQAFFSIIEKIDLVLTLMKKDLENIRVIREDEKGIPELLADPGMMEHALVNMIQNAAHALSKSEKPSISIRTYCRQDEICFEIEDNGCGIPERYIQKIFEPSFTMKGSKDKTHSYEKEIKGTGYGMSNVKKYVEQHKGRVEVWSRFDQGSRFTVFMPVIKKELTSREKAELAREPRLQTGKKILVVEDEPAVAKIQNRILSNDPCRHQVDLAFTGREAMKLFNTNGYDFVVLDYILPENVNGMEVYKEIRQTDPAVPVLFISGNIEFLESIMELKQNDPFLGHLSKPFRNKEYIWTVNRLFEKRMREAI
ncbi:MAG: response regulator [Desulfobacterales bacterium]|nr:response regulator [Desulfobacterales bacterium]